MVLIAALAYGVSRRAGGVAAALPTLGALALGAQRVLPLLQQAYSAWANIVGSQASAKKVLELLDQPIAPELLSPAPKPLAFSRDIRFSNVRFRYAPDAPWVLDGLQSDDSQRRADRDWSAIPAAARARLSICSWAC